MVPVVPPQFKLPAVISGPSLAQPKYPPIIHVVEPKKSLEYLNKPSTSPSLFQREEIGLLQPVFKTQVFNRSSQFGSTGLHSSQSNDVPPEGRTPKLD